MNNLNKAYKEVSSLGEFSNRYFSYLFKVLQTIDESEINKLDEIFEESRNAGNTDRKSTRLNSSHW